MHKKLVMGNQAFAYAALAAGVRVVAGYPARRRRNLSRQLPNSRPKVVPRVSTSSGRPTKKPRSRCWQVHRMQERAAFLPANKLD